MENYSLIICVPLNLTKITKIVIQEVGPLKINSGYAQTLSAEV